ncbi:hypothetical protein BH23BAC3_BH23BAC3_28440 [soil metagenome]
MSLEKIKRRKEELQAEIDRIEDNYISKASEIERKVKSVLRPVHNIRKKPFTTVGISVAVGFVIGFLRKKKSRKTQKSHKSSPSDFNGKSDTGFTTLLMAELKRLAAQRAMTYVSEVIDQRVMPRLSKSNDERGEKSEAGQKMTDRN